MEVKVVDGLVRVLAVVHDDSVALDVLLAANLGDCDHHVPQESLVLCSIPHIDQRVQRVRLGKEDQVDFG